MLVRVKHFNIQVSLQLPDFTHQDAEGETQQVISVDQSDRTDSSLDSNLGTTRPHVALMRPEAAIAREER